MTDPDAGAVDRGGRAAVGGSRLVGRTSRAEEHI